MKLKLRITETETKNYTKPKLRFVVIDQDKSKQYPANFVCILPKTIKNQTIPANNFERIFGDKSKELAVQLLKKALRSRPSVYVRTEIRKRVDILNPKPKNLARCNVCGEEFKARRFGYRLQKTCYGCLNKIHSSKN